MKTKRTRVVPHRRRREGKTDYRLRLKLLKSGKHRFVVRYSLNNIVCQVVQYGPKGDKTLATADSKELKKFGWKGHTGNMPAAYLVGYLCGLRAKKGKVSDCIFDAGLYASIRGTRIYSALKGAIDAGLKVPCSKEALPSEDRVSGKHIESYAGKMKKEHPDAYKRQFSAYAKSKTEPESLSKHFSEVKAKLKA